MYNVSQKNETHVILTILHSCKSIAMALAIKCLYNLPPHLSYVSTLPDIIQTLKPDTDELKQRLDTWDHIPQSIIDNRLRTVQDIQDYMSLIFLGCSVYAITCVHVKLI